MLKKMIGISLILLISACSTTPTSSTKTNDLSQPKRSQSAELTTDVYAKLTKSANGYEFRDFSLNQVQQPLWVNLRTGALSWNASEVRECQIGLLIKDTSRNHCDNVEGESGFYESSLDHGGNAGRVVAAFFTLGLTLTGVSYEVEFDEDAFREAYDAAFNKLDINGLNQAILTINKAKANLEREAYNYQKAVANANSFPQLTIIDRSGLYDKSIHPSKLVRYKANRFEPSAPYRKDSIDQFIEAANAYEAEVNKGIGEMFSVAIVECQSRVNTGFNLINSCPKTLPVREGKVAGDLKFTVQSKRVDRVMPKYFASEDDQISIDFDGHSIGFSNLTNKFVTIESIAFYHDGKIAQRDRMNLEFAPNASTIRSTRIRISDFPVDWGRLSFNWLTKEKAAKTSISYGFAVKYRVSDGSTVKTLYSKKDYRLLDLI